MLEIKDLCVSIYGTEVLKGINLTIPDGETHILFGPNGSGKTSLLMTLMGYPQYKITQGEIKYNGVLLNPLAINERAALGIGVFFQRPPIIKGMKLKDVLTEIMKKSGVDINIEKGAEALKLNGLIGRDINSGFSGGEIKRSELMQLFAQNPHFVMLDEPESGVDLENMVMLGGKIRMLLGRGIKKEERKKSALIITHTGYVLDYVDADAGYTLLNGKIQCKHDAMNLFKHIQKHGFTECELCRET
jgi:Fe-S cluster assembly ATP-binding protein